MPKLHLIGLTVVGLLASVAASAADMGADYVAKAGAGDLYEIEASKLVLGTTKNPALKNFAAMMVKDHTQSSKMVKDAALADHLTLKPVTLDKEKRAAVQDLAQAKGTDRDALYVKQQAAAHQAALTLHSSYSQSGDKPALKAAATKITPVVQHHIEMLKQIAAK